MEKQKVYLVGSMESASDLGSGWRENITPFLENLNLEVLDPCKFEPEQLKGCHLNSLPKKMETRGGKRIKPTHWHQLKRAKDPVLYQRFLKYMRKIIEFDCNIVINVCDFIIVLWDDNAGKGAGTHTELSLGYLHKKPIYMVNTAETIPAWLQATVTEEFHNFDDLEEFLVKTYGNK